MKPWHILSRRNVEEKTDFSPADPAGMSPFAQLRRLSAALKDPVAPIGNLGGMDDALDAYREHLYRKIYTGTSHDEFVALNEIDPQRIDWLIAVADTDAEHFRNSKKSN